MSSRIYKRLEESQIIQQRIYRNCMSKMEATNERTMQTIARLQKFIIDQDQCLRVRLHPETMHYRKQNSECIKIKMY